MGDLLANDWVFGGLMFALGITCGLNIAMIALKRKG